jgi:hypothetical protein
MKNFKQACFGAATMAVMATVPVATMSMADFALNATPSHAAALTNGSLNIVTSTAGTPTGSGNLTLGITTSSIAVKSGGFAGATGTPVFTTLALTKVAANEWTTGPIANFLTGLSVGGDAVSFDITSPIQFFGSFADSNNYALSASIINGLFKNSSGSILGSGAITGVQVGSNQSSSVNLVATSTAIPTPALLPGLLGVGFAAFRRQRKQTAVQA